MNAWFITVSRRQLVNPCSGNNPLRLHQEKIMLFQLQAWLLGSSCVYLWESHAMNEEPHTIFLSQLRKATNSKSPRKTYLSGQYSNKPLLGFIGCSALLRIDIRWSPFLWSDIDPSWQSTFIPHNEQISDYKPVTQ